MKKKVLSTMLVAAMAASMLAGCTSSDGGSNGGNGGSSNGGTTTIRLMRACFNCVPDSARTQEVEDAINAYLKDLGKNYVIELDDINSGEYTEKANLAIAGNEVDLVWTAAWESTIGCNDLVPANAVKDITDLIKGTDLYNSMDANTWEATQYDGKNYFIPVYKDNVEGYNLMFRTDLVEKYGIDVASVKGIKDLTPILEKLSAEGLKYTYLTQKTALFYRYYIDSFDFFTGDATSNFVCVDRNTNSVINTIQTKEYEEFCTLMAEWHEAGYLSTDDATKTTTDTTTQTQDWAVSWWTDVPNNAEASNRYNQDVQMAKITSNWLHTDSALGSCYAITQSCKDDVAKAAIDFMGVLYTDSKLADIYTYGIEGKDFNYEGGYVAQVEGATYNHSMWESASATAVTAPAASPYTAQMYIDFNNSKISCANGFHFDKTPVEDKYAACQNVFEQYGFILENGGFASSEVKAKIAEYQSALDAAGYQDVLAEFQKQYDAWK